VYARLGTATSGQHRHKVPHCRKDQRHRAQRKRRMGHRRRRGARPGKRNGHGERKNRTTPQVNQHHVSFRPTKRTSRHVARQVIKLAAYRPTPYSR